MARQRAQKDHLGESILCMADVSDYHALGLSSYIFNTGYMNQQWTDVQILFFDAGIKLHRSGSGFNWADLSRSITKSIPRTSYAQLSAGRLDPPQLSGRQHHARGGRLRDGADDRQYISPFTICIHPLTTWSTRQTQSLSLPRRTSLKVCPSWFITPMSCAGMPSTRRV